MEMYKTAVYSVECLKDKPIATPLVTLCFRRVRRRR